jgi:hypothetical protein
MEFDIGNILYIVITLVAVIIGVLGKKKKKAQKSTGEEAGESRPGFLENLERMLTMGQENPAVADLQEFEEDLPPEGEHGSEEQLESRFETLKAPNIMDDYDRIMKGDNQTGEDFYFVEGDGMSEDPEVIDLDKEPGTDFFKIVQDFDARTAIVYSVIINRLDY